MSPTWRREDNDQLIEARRIQAELAESAGILMTLADRLSGLAAELNAEAEVREPLSQRISDLADGLNDEAAKLEDERDR